MKKLFVFLLAICSVLFIAGCTKDLELSIEEAHKSVELEVGDTFTVKATFTEGAELAWESNDPSIVTVDAGVLTAISEGETKVVVSIKDTEISVEIDVEVVEKTPTSVEITGAEKLVIGQVSSYTAKVFPDIAKQEVTWSVDNSELASIEENGALTAKAEGTVVVTATTKKGDVKDTITVVIEKPAPTTVTVSGENSVVLGATLQLSAIIAPDLASQEVTWSVDNEAVATIDATGKLTPVAPGEVVVTATAKGTEIKGQLTVTITKPAAESVALTGENSVEAGSTLQLSASVTPALADQSIVWSVDNETIATIDQNGLLTGLTGGVVVVTATAKDTQVKATLSVTVIKAIAKIGSTEYETLAEAVAAAVDGDVIVLTSGSFELKSVNIDKDITIEGPNKGVHGNDERQAEAVITADAITVNGSLTLDGLKFTGSSTTTILYGGATLETLIMKNCVVDYYKNIFYTDGAHNADVEANVTFENNRIQKLGQFIIWINTSHGAGYKSFNLFNNYVSEDGLATISAENGMISIRPTGNSDFVMNIIGNYLPNPTSNSYFRFNSGTALVKHNVFANVSLYQSANSTTAINYDENLYLDATGAALTAAPAKVSEYGGIADTKVLSSQDEQATKAAAWIKAYYSNTIYNIKYELNGGELVGEAPTTYKGSLLPLALPTAKLEGKTFLGWYDNKDFLGKKITSIPMETTGDLTFYARFGEEWQLKALEVGAGREYETISEALEVAEAGSYIVIYPGTYAEDLEIKKDSITILGPNKGIAYDGTREEEALVNSIKIDADNIIIDGLKMTAIEPFEIKGGNNITIQNSIFGSTNTTSNQSMILISGDANDVYILNNSGIGTKVTSTHYRAILTKGLITNLVVKGNYFAQDASSSTMIDSIRLEKIAGHIIIEENEFNWPGGNFTIYLGSASVAANTLVDINYNKFASTAEQSGVAVRSLNDTSVVNVIGNSFSNVGGNVVQVRGASGSGDTTTKVTANIMYNAFLDTSTKMSISCDLTNVNFASNYAFQEYVWSALTATVNDGKANAEEALEGVKKHKVEFELNGATATTLLPTEYVEGAVLKLNVVTFKYVGQKFLGWFDNPEFAGEAITSLGEGTSDVKLYAKFEAIPVIKLSYELNGGSCEDLVKSDYQGTIINLPTPEKYGFVFLGWTLEASSDQYISTITLDKDVTLYANWLEAEVYTVDLVLNGGSMRYSSRDAVVADFVKDYSAIMNKGYTSASQIKGGNFEDCDFHTFFTKTLADGTTVREKWLWLAEYIYELSVRDLASNNCNVLGLKTLLDNGAYSGDGLYGVSYAFRGFLKGTTMRPGSSYTSVNFSNYQNANNFWAHLSASEDGKFETYGTSKLPTPGNGLYVFIGWFDNPECTGDPITEVTGPCKLYAKYGEGTPVESISITNKVEEMKRFDELQLKWTLNPASATITSVKFESSNPEIVSVTTEGYIVALTNGTATIKIISDSETGAYDEMTVVVYSPDHFDISYETESYVGVNGTIALNAKYVKRGDVVDTNITWSSLNEAIASVENGVVTGKKAGVATIRATLASNPDVYFDFSVTVLAADLIDPIKFAIESHESNIFTRYDLGIGAGGPVYWEDIFGSVSKILFNQPLEINDKFLAQGNEKRLATTSDPYLKSLEFITVHYTGNMGKGSDAEANANYFVQSNVSTSIHYTTGNDGVFQALNDEYRAGHAGDTASVDLVGHFEWLPTGVAYDDCDLLDVEFSASNDAYYEINGKKTTIKIPATWNYSNRGTDHTFDANGNVVNKLDGSVRPIESYFNKLGFAVKVVNNQYYMGKTWWCYDQVKEGRICSNGGNYNSIGIESCVDVGSDLWLTWQMTAQLVASLMAEHGLDISRVKGHHFYSGKDCPQPMLENDCEIWAEFLELVQAEYDLLTKYSEYNFMFSVDKADASVVDALGRVIEQPEYATIVNYSLLVENADGSVFEEVKLASAINGVYSKN